MRWNRFIRIMMTALLLIGTFVIVYPSAGEEEHPIEMTITLPSDLELTEHLKTKAISRIRCMMRFCPAALTGRSDL